MRVSDFPPEAFGLLRLSAAFGVDGDERGNQLLPFATVIAACHESWE